MVRIINIGLILTLLIVELVFPSSIHAMSISISNLPESIDKDQETEVEVFFNCSGCGDSYMRGVFYPSGTNYFGFTQNNKGDWVGTEADRSLYFTIAKSDLVDASWSGKLKIKPDPADSAYNGPGEYLFKLGRYTSSGDSSADWSNELAIKITGPAPTATPTKTPDPTNTPTSVPTTAPTKTPTPTPKKTPTSTPTPTPTSSSSATPNESVLGNNTEFPDFKTPESTSAGKIRNKLPLLAISLIVLGLGLVGFSIFSIIKNAKKSYTDGSEKEDNQIL
jgi:hypothetical protein